MTSLSARGIAIPGRLQPTDLALDSPQAIALIGPNGGGKTSLLRALARVEGALGSVTVNGEDLDGVAIARRRRLIGYMPASHDVAWPIAVRDLVRLGGADGDDGRIDILLDHLGLASLQNRRMTELSTGERTRALLARVLAAQPLVLLLDEPLSNLDPFWALTVLDLLRVYASERIVMMALHDLTHLPRFDRTLMITGGSVLADEAPASLLADERFEKTFGVRRTAAGFAIIPPADPQSSQ